MTVHVSGKIKTTVSFPLHAKGGDVDFCLTPIEEIPATIQEKAKLFSRVYREAKQKGVLECPHYRSIFIDEVLANLPKGEVC